MNPFDMGMMNQTAQVGGDMGGKMSDTAEQVQISSLSLLKMLKHGKAGIPLEVMGLMLGDFVDDYTVKCIDVFAMPQSGTETTIETFDEGFQAKMHEMLKQVGRNEIVVGWYHSHPGFGCFLSQTDVKTQESFQKLHDRFVAVVVDPIQSVRGKVVIEAFRNYEGGMMNMSGTEQRQTTSNTGNVTKPIGKGGFSMKDLSKIQYYNLLINFRKNDYEIKMLQNLHKDKWYRGLTLTDLESLNASNIRRIKEIASLSEKYSDWIESELDKSTKDANLAAVGKFNPREHLSSTVDETISENVNHSITQMLTNVVF